MFMLAFSAVKERQYKNGVNILYVKVKWLLLNDKMRTQSSVEPVTNFLENPKFQVVVSAFFLEISLEFFLEVCWKLAKKRGEKRRL